jgi:hypothetical protein
VARHVWLSRQFKARTVELALRAAAQIHPAVKDYVTATRFAGYAVERIRQNGGVLSPSVIARGARHSRHLYAVGHNRDNYLDAGRRILAQAAGMKPETELAVVWDYLSETGRLPTA